MYLSPARALETEISFTSQLPSCIHPTQAAVVGLCLIWRPPKLQHVRCESQVTCQVSRLRQLALVIAQSRTEHPRNRSFVNRIPYRLSDQKPSLRTIRSKTVSCAEEKAHRCAFWSGIAKRKRETLSTAFPGEVDRAYERFVSSMPVDRQPKIYCIFEFQRANQVAVR